MSKRNKVLTGITTWERWDRYEAIIPCKNRLLTAWRALIKGNVKIKWEVPSSKKHKGFYLKGKLE